MSIYTGTSGKNILNIANQSQALDVDTRNPYYTTVVGYQAAPLNVGLYNTIFGYKAGNKTKKTARNIYMGANAGLNNNANDNIIIGFNAAMNMVNGAQNICMGNNVANNLNGNNNIYIGYNNTADSSNNYDSSNNVGRLGRLDVGSGGPRGRGWVYHRAPGPPARGPISQSREIGPSRPDLRYQRKLPAELPATCRSLSGPSALRWTPSWMTSWISWPLLRKSAR